jgi:hypothetical protein
MRFRDVLKVWVMHRLLRMRVVLVCRMSFGSTAAEYELAKERIVAETGYPVLMLVEERNEIAFDVLPARDIPSTSDLMVTFSPLADG